MVQFEKPNYKITDYVESNFFGKFELEPLERGFGTTLGNALRRVMLSSLPGSAISSIKIEGALHEFQTLEGVVEDVTTIILNLKQVVVKNYTDNEKTIRIDVDKEGPVTAGDIIHDSDIEILNPDLLIANVAKGGKLVIDMNVSNGRGYVRSEENKKLLDNKKVGVISKSATLDTPEAMALSASINMINTSSSVLQQNHPLTPAFLAGTPLFKCLPKYPT